MIERLKYQLYRFINPNLFRRMNLARKVSNLATLISSQKLVPIEIQTNGDAYLVMPDGIKLFYNTDIQRGTLGDGQSLDYYGTEKRYLKDAKAAEKVIFKHLKKGTSYIDVGANNGYFYAIKIASKIQDASVICFEPDPYILPHLQKNIKINKLQDKITLIKKGLSDKKGRFYLRKGLGASGYLVNERPDNIDLFHAVQTVALDDVVKDQKIKKIDMIKIDIEGGEHRFLLGAQKTLKKLKPVLLIELRDELLKRSGASFDQVKNMVTALGYDLYKSPYNDDYFAVQKTHKLEAVLKSERFKKI